MALNSITGFASFKPILGICCDLVNPDVVVEWGPGASTEFMLEKTNAVIHTWENAPSYYNQAKNTYEGNNRVVVYNGVGGRGNGKNPAYANAPMLMFQPGSVKLLFVDGRARADCMICAAQLVSDDGIVVLHDDARPAYDQGRQVYPFCFRNGGTITGVYSKNEALINRVEERFDINTVPKGYGGTADIPV